MPLAGSAAVRDVSQDRDSDCFPKWKASRMETEMRA